MVDRLLDAVSQSDSLLSRACRLLRCEDVPETDNGLLQAFVAGGEQLGGACPAADLIRRS